MTDWPVKTLGEVCDFVRGVTYDKADARSETKSGFIPLLRATNITEKGLLREDFVFIPSDGVRADQKLMSGDALITIASGSASVVGRSVLVEDPGEMTFGAFCGVLRPSPKILPRYLSHFMSSRSVRTSWSEAAQGTNINNLKRDDILQTECLLPPLDEQKRIVELLDAATARVAELTACYEQARTHANNLFTSALEDALEGNADSLVKNLGNLFDFQNGRGFKKTEWAKSGFPIIRIQNLNSESAPHNYFSGRFDQRILVESGDLLFSWSGSIGTSFGPHIWQRSAGLLNQHIFKVIPKVPIDTSYAHYCLRLITAEIERSVNGAVGLVHITKEKLNKFEIPVPSMDEQKRIVARLDSMRAKTSEMVAAYDAKLTAAKNLRQSVLEAAFAGEL